MDEILSVIYGANGIRSSFISDKKMIHDLELKKVWGIENSKLFLKSFETLYLLIHKKTCF